MTPVLWSLVLVLLVVAAGAALALWALWRRRAAVHGAANPGVYRSGVVTRHGRVRLAQHVDTRHSLSAWREAHRVLAQAVELPPGERESFLAEEYGDNSEMLRELESLLRAHDSTGPLDRLGAQLALPDGSLPTTSGGEAGDDDPVRLAGISPNTDLIGGHYALLAKLGEGGMGVVHRARDMRLGRDVALKFLPPDLHAAGVARKRFILEAKAAAALDHPNICTVHEIGETRAGNLFIAMALCDGDTLARRMAQGPIHWEDALGIVQQVASGLARAHEAGIVHRDIKPANLCITTDGVVKIVDFGIAKVADATLSDAGPLLGTLAYMSPEMVRGELVDHSTDLWSLGVVLFEMLTGTRLFPGDDWVKVLAAIRSDAPFPLGRLRGTAPWPVIGLVRRMLSRNRADRFPNADYLDSAIRAAIEAAHRSAGPPEDAGGALAAGGERRHVTVVESHVVGHPGVTSQRGPDGCDARMLRLYETAREVVHAHGGVLNAFEEGRMTSVFGVPITHEDDVVRAARVAFDLNELVSIDEDGDQTPLTLHTGVASGTVEASVAEGDTTTRYELNGPPAVTAQTLASMAAAGEILVSGDDCRTLSTRFIVEPCDRFRHGTDETATPVASLVGRSEAHVRDIFLTTHLTTFTGRERELEKLFLDLEGAMAGEGRAVTIVGEAGAGKTRLLYEFRRKLQGEAARLSLGSCHPDSSSKPYHPITEAMRHTLALDRDASGIEARELVMRSIRKLSPDLEVFAPVYLKLLAIDSGEATASLLPDGQRARGAISEALTAFFTLAASELPTVLLFEDFHWADEASCQMLAQLCEISQSYPILVVVTHRPGSDVKWNGAMTGSLVQLSSLRLEDSSRMARALLGMGDIPDDVARVLHERAGGNPFFLEELCRSLLEAGVLNVENGRARLSSSPDSLHLPGTVQGIIRSRLDRLSPEARDVVRAASVLGRDFTLSLLERMGPEHYALARSLATLTSLGITRQVQVVPERMYRFRHVLTQEVAYDTLLPHQRRAMHRQAARAITTVHAERLEEYAPMLAHHFSAGEDWFEAARHGYIAAHRTLELCEYPQALATLQAVDEWLARVPGGPERDELQVNVLLEQEELFEVLGNRERQSEILHRLLQIPRVVADKLRLAEVYRRLGDRYTVLREFGKARMSLEEALRLTRETGDRTTESAVLRSLGLVGWYTGDPESALPLIDAALAMERERFDYNAIATSLNSRSLILKDMGRSAEALKSIEEGLAILDHTTSDVAGACVLTTAGTLYRTNGDVNQALHYLELADVILGRRNLPIHESFIAAAKAHAYLARGDLDMAVEAAEQGVTSTRRSGFTDGLARSLCSLAELLIGTGREAHALTHLQEAAELFQRIGALHMERPVRERTASVAERTGEQLVAREAWLRCRTIAEQLGDTGILVRAQLGVARNTPRSGPEDFAESEAALGEALSVSREAEMDDQELKALNSLGILEWERGRYEVALEHYEAALTICRVNGDDTNAGVILNSQGVCLRALGRLSESRAAVSDALDTSRRSGQRLVEAHALALLGDIALDAGETADARTMFDSALELRRALNDRKGEGWMHHSIARAAGKEGAVEGAVEAAVAALVAAREIAMEMNDVELVQACDEVTVLTPK